jgi:predicted TIM-barrel fold metal-dependent hydrolase
MTSSAQILQTSHSATLFKLPSNSVDCHTHIFGPSSLFPWDSARSYTPGDASIEQLNALHKHLGIERVVIVHPSPYGSDNACTLNALKVMGLDRARGVAVIDALTSVEELRAMHALGVRGVRINLQTYGLEDPKQAEQLLRHTQAQVAQLGWHIQIFTKLPVLLSLIGFIKEMSVPLVIDHFCLVDPHLGLEQDGLADLLELLASGKVWIKLSAAYRISSNPDHADVKALAKCLITANPKRVVWGSDWPHPGGGAPRTHRDIQQIEPFQPIDDGQALNRLMQWTSSEQELHQILVTNPSELYGF